MAGSAKPVSQISKHHLSAKQKEKKNMYCRRDRGPKRRQRTKVGKRAVKG
jgi:hypothetical protein